jgi:hypothetical protein
MDAPYGPNNTLADLGGFFADERGIVFTAIPNTTDYEDGKTANDYPSLLVAGDLDGNLKTIFTSDTGMITNLVVDADRVYFSLLIGASQLVSVPRGGGAPMVLVERGVRSGPLTDGKRLYYRGTTDTFNDGLFAIDKTGGAPTLLTDRGDQHLRSAAIEGDTLYFVDTEGFEAENDDVLYKLELATGNIEELAKVPVEASGHIDVANGVVYSSLISDSFSIEIHRIEPGKVPVKTAARGGLPLVLADGFAYYPASSSGIAKDSLTFDNPATLPGSSGKTIFALAAGPNEIWYAEQHCIYRTPK